MLDPIPDSEPRPRLAPSSSAAQALENLSVRAGLDRILRHARVEPLIRRLFPDQRRYDRIVIPHIVAYLGNAHASRPHQIANISIGGFCMLTEELWTPGAEMPITLQREEWDGEESPECISVQAIVARLGCGEVGFSTALTPEESIAFSAVSASGRSISKTTMEEFLENLKKPKPPRLFPVDCPRERPMAMAERTERLLEIARLHCLSTASELWHSQSR